MRILAVGGGSGGHVTPIAAVVNELVKQNENVEVELVCDKPFLLQAKKVMAVLPVSVPVSVITAGKFRRYAHFSTWDYVTTPSVTLRNAGDVFKTIWGLLQSIVLIIRKRPDVVFAKGGYVCLPVGIAAWLLRVPVVIHDSDARAGLTNRVLSRFASKIATGYPVEYYSYPEDRTTYTGVPIRADFTYVNAVAVGAAKERLGIDSSDVLVTAIGGGLGSISINSAMLAAAPELLKNDRVRLWIIAGKVDEARVRDKARDFGGRVNAEGFVVGDTLTDVLRAADIVVTRASATTIQELAGLGKTIIAVPARALGDQQKNAELLKKSTAAAVLSDDELTEGKLVHQLTILLNDEQLAERYKESLHTLARPDAAEATALLISQAAHR